MKPRRVAVVCCSIVMTSAAAFSQQQPDEPAPRITERTYVSGGLMPTRSVQRRSESQDREIVVDTEQRLDGDGKWTPVEEIVTETLRTADTVRTRRDAFGFDVERRRWLMETTESTQQALDGGIRTVEETSVADINGGVRPITRWVEETTTIAPDARQTEATLFSRGINGGLRESERTIHTERRVEPAVVRHEITQQTRDPNGRWMTVESRSAEARETGSSELIEEEIIRRPDLNGTLAVSERIVTRRSEENGREQVVVETYSRNAEGLGRIDSRLGLTQRIRRSTAATVDGGRSTIEEVEARSLVSPGDPMRVVQRTVVTVRNGSTERQVFELDVNGRLAPVRTETEEMAAK